MHALLARARANVRSGKMGYDISRCIHGRQRETPFYKSVLKYPAALLLG